MAETESQSMEVATEEQGNDMAIEDVDNAGQVDEAPKEEPIEPESVPDEITSNEAVDSKPVEDEPKSLKSEEPATDEPMEPDPVHDDVKPDETEEIKPESDTQRNDMAVEDDHGATTEQTEQAAKDEPMEPEPVHDEVNPDETQENKHESETAEGHNEPEVEQKASQGKSKGKATPKGKSKKVVNESENEEEQAEEEMDIDAEVEEKSARPKAKAVRKKAVTKGQDQEPTTQRRSTRNSQPDNGKVAEKPEKTPAKANGKPKEVKSAKAVASQKKTEATPLKRKSSFEISADVPASKRRSVAKTPKVVKHAHSYEEFVNKTGYERVLTCGDGEQLGHPGRTTTKKPRAIDTLPEDIKVLQVVAGGVHTTILTDKNEVYSCGINEGGTCPVKGLEAEGTTDELTIIEFTDEIQKEGKIVMLTSGAGFTAALTDLGSVLAWGNLRDENGSYELHSLFGKMRAGPTVILHHGDVVIAKIEAGENHLAMLSVHGEVYTFGEGSHGQLGGTNRMGSMRSMYVADQTGKSLKRTVFLKSKMIKFTDVFAGGFWTMARAEDGRIFVCGLNNFGQLGLPIPKEEEDEEPEERNKKLIVGKLTPSDAFSPQSKWTHIAGVKHVIARNDDGEVYGIGLNTDNELGIGTYTGKGDEEHWRYSELQKIIFPGEAKIAGITATLGSSIAWTSEGDAFGWGYDSVGQLGLGISDEDEKAVKIPKLIKSAHLDGYKIKSVNIADNHALFLAAKAE